MAAKLDALCIDALDPESLTHFWAGVLGQDVTAVGTGIPRFDTGFGMRFIRTQAPKSGPNQMHFDLTSTSLEDQQRTVNRALGLGATHLDVGQTSEDAHVVLADPEGNEFCVIEPGNNFLANTAVIGALSCDGSRQVGYFWSAALGWPLVWNQDQETAIQSPDGGTKISWGGPPVRPKTARNRFHFDLTPPVPGDHLTEVDRLVSLGATRLLTDDDHVAMTDPDGNEFCVLRT